MTGKRPYDAMVNRLRYWREKRGKTRDEVARLAACHMQTIRKLEDGTMKFNQAWMERLAPILGVAPGDFLPLATYVAGSHPVRYVPVISWASAGRPMEALQTEIDETSQRVAVLHRSENLLAVVISGTSMERVAPPGSFAVYDRDDTDLIDGKYYLFAIDNEVTFKRYRSTEGPIRLEPDSFTPHSTIYPDAHFRVIGRVVEIIRKL